jgi:hypothetical protein
MSKPKRPIRPIQKNISVPEDLAAQVDLELFSELEGRVPYGAWSKFVETILLAHFDKQPISKEN